MAGADQGTASKGTVLIVEDEESIADLVRLYLEREGYRVEWRGDGRSGLAAVSATRPRLVVLDLMLPGMDGFEVLKALRDGGGRLPVIVVTAREEEADRVLGLELGADDYVTKPFSIRELLARVRAILRRSDGSKRRLARYRFSDVELDFEVYRATKGGTALEMSPREFELLRYLIERKGDTVSRDQLLEDVWGYESYPSTRTVDTHIAKLRAKIGDSGSEPRYILTMHGSGYKFVDPT